jgi:hypothetical protein
MPKRRVTPNRPRDVNQLAKRIVEIATGQAEDEAPPTPDPSAVERGNARARHTTPEQRRETARKAARTRWDKKNGHP